MSFAQLTYRDSLADIEVCLRSRPDQLYHMGFRSRIAHSTLAEANSSRDWRIYHDLAQVLIAPMLDYWLRMASGAYALVGAWYLALMIWPQKFASAIPWFGALMLAERCILLFHGIRLSLPPFPFYGDTAACFVGGGGILYFSRYANPQGRSDGA